MKMRIRVAGIMLPVITMPALAGVEMDLVTRNADGAVVESVKVFAQSGRIRMEDVGDTTGQDMSMIFIDQEFIVIDHDDLSYIVVDGAMVAEMGVKVNAAIAQIKAQLASMPPEQRAMVEQMMEGQMAGFMNSEAAPPSARVVEIGAGSWESGDCTEYDVIVGEKRTQKICAASLDDVNGAEEAMAAFENMAKFIKTLSDSMPGPLGASMAENPMGMMEQIKGFPVRTVDYLDGVKVAETTLSSLRDKSLDAALFSVPEGYTRKDPFAGQ